MRQKTTKTAILLLSLALLPVAAWAEDDIVEAALKACEPEIKTYCSQVTPGEGRLLACFYAHGDKISPSCEYGLYLAAAELEEFVTAISYLATQCADDLEKHCADVEMGEGRVASCLLEHKEEATEACQKAIDDTELEVVD